MNNFAGVSASEVHPVIVTDRDLVNYVDEFDIDLDYLADYLRSRGLSDDQINNLTIEFSAKDTIIQREPTIRLTMGKYESQRARCTIWLGSILIGSYLISNDVSEVEKQTLRFTRGFTAQSLAHEAEHYVADVERDFAPDPSYIQFRSFGDEDSDEAYRTQPEEIRAQAVEDNFSPAAILIR